MYRIHQIKLGLEEKIETIPEKIKLKTGKPDLEIKEWKIIKESIDARKKNSINKVYTVDFTCNMSVDCDEAPNLRYEAVKLQNNLIDRPIIVGFGPCGIFAALILAQAGAKPIIIERGKSVDERSIDVKQFWEDGILDENSNVQFGEGGAGTFSDGKLTTGTKDIRIRKVLEELNHAGADNDILYKQKPHIGTDNLKYIVKNIRKKIISLGGEIHFSTTVRNLLIENNQIVGVVTDKETYKSHNVIFAIGHSARDTFRMLKNNNMDMQQKPFSMGVRIQHPQSIINIAQYGNESLAKILGPAEYKLSYHCKNGRGVYTFCMCPGGEVICASSEKGQIVTNGMSNSARDGKYANSGLLVDVRTEDFGTTDPLGGMYFQEKYEKRAYELAEGYKLLNTTWGNFAKSNITKCLPGFVVESILEAVPMMARKLKHFDDKNTEIFGIETRSSSPVRLIRNEGYMSNIKGIYPAGEGAGYAGGIVSAAVDGIKVAEEIIRRG